MKLANNTVTIDDSTGAISPALVLDNLTFPKTSGVGIKVDTSSPVFGWKDLISTIYPKTTGSGAPDLKVLQGNIKGFAYSTGDDGDVNYHIAHDYLPNSDMYIHAHWEHTGTAISGKFALNMYCSYCKGYNQAGEIFQPEIVIPIIRDTVNIATYPRYGHFISEEQLSASGGVIASAVNVSITSGTATLTSASALFDQYDVGKTVRISGAGVAGGNLDTTIAAFTSTTQVTLTDNASTTVTLQPNFKSRVLDTAKLEVDGLINVHYDFMNIPTITGATTPASANEPFLLFIDLHYQSTQLATKGRNYPNFYT